MIPSLAAKPSTLIGAPPPSDVLVPRPATQLMEASPTNTGESTRGPLWAWLTGTFFGIGTLKPGPGTWGSLTTVLLWAAIAHYTPANFRLPLNVALAALAIIIGI